MNLILENLINTSMWAITALLVVSLCFLLISMTVWVAKRLSTRWGLLYLVVLGAFLYFHHTGHILTPVEYVEMIQSTS